jgi:hypothetical protein
MPAHTFSMSWSAMSSNATTSLTAVHRWPL